MASSFDAGLIVEESFWGLLAHMVKHDLINGLLEIAGRISRGEIPPYEHNECYTSGAFDLLLVGARGPRAFELLTELCCRYSIVEEAGEGLEGYYHLLALIARQSDTTEMPSGMQTIISDHPELSRDLREWYRIQG